MIKTIIVDDEHDAVDFIRSIVEEFCPELEIIGTAYSVTEAEEIIKRENPDLIFLDVEMPHGNGFDLLEKIPEKTFEVIFITAFNHYAIQAIKFSAVDYILKPINIEEFVKSVEKVKVTIGARKTQISSFSALLENIKSATPGKLAIPTSDGMEYLNTENIIRIQADRSYSWFYMEGGIKHLVSKNLKEYQELLSERKFFRSHNSHLVNLEHVKKFIRHGGGYIEMSDGSKVAVSRSKKDLFLIEMSKLAKN
ncbi:LytR/AlgR family response regulator transcription factor [Bacteroidota bacterium]